MTEPYPLRSPINGQTVQAITRFEFYNLEVYKFKHGNHRFGDFYCTESVVTAIQDGQFHSYNGYGEKYSARETRAALDLIRSLLYRTKDEFGPFLLITGRSEKETVGKTLQSWKTTPNVILKSMQDMVNESHSLTLAQKAHETLRNLYAQFEAEPKPLNSDYIGISQEGSRITPTFKPILASEAPQRFEDGSTFGCNELTGHFVYQYLFESEFVQWHNGIRISAKGYDVVDTMERTGGIESTNIFVVRQFYHPANDMLNAACQEVGERLGLQVGPVWNTQHNEKIDERIFREISKARAVVVDITPSGPVALGEDPPKELGDRINVGIEAGFALALNKPIILIRRAYKEHEDPDWYQHRPFDISTMACFDYGREANETNHKELVDVLTAKLQFAFNQLLK